jgi:virginiamycin B lyase
VNPIRPRILGRLLGALALLALTLPSSAQGDCCLYWSTGANDTIGRAPLTGFYPEWSFIRDVPGGAFGIAADANHLYWGGEASIGRVGLAGSDLESGWIGGLADSRRTSVAVDAAHVYWVEPARNSIGRANLDGSGVDESFIATEFPVGLSVDGAHIYWVRGLTGAIGRADLDGRQVEESFIVGANLPVGVAVDAGHVYWSNFGADSIGRANLDGSGADQRFISPVGDPWGLAVDSGHVYWTDLSTGNIGRANLDGSDVDAGFIDGAGAFNLALGPPGAVGDLSAKRSQPQHGDKIRIRLKVSADQRLVPRAGGELVVGKGKRSYGLEQLPFRPKSVRPGEARALRLKPRSERNERRIVAELEAGGEAIARVHARLVASAGLVERERFAITLKR